MTAAAAADVVSRPAVKAAAPAPPSSLAIGEAARRSGFSIKALRFYERRGLLPPSGRSAGGFRLYTEADLHRLEFIRQAKALGLSLDQIGELLVTSHEQTCAMTRPLLVKKLGERIRQTAEQIEALSRLKDELARRRRLLGRRPPTDHRRGYCACFETSQGAVLVRRILPKGRRPARLVR